MHEMGIAGSILEAVATEVAMRPGNRAMKVGVAIGEFAGVDTESLRFCFEVLRKEQQPELELEIDWRTGTDDLKLAFLEMEEVFDGKGSNREEGLKRERSDCGAIA